MTRRTMYTRGNRGFTLMEVLASLMLMAIVLPAVMNGITLSSNAASVARHRNEASGLAESKLGEILATDQWENGAALNGDFSTDWPEYRWEATVQPWTQDSSTITNGATASSVAMQQLNVKVIWQSRNKEESITLSTLAYSSSSTSSTGSSASQ